MPIFCPIEVRPISEDEFVELDYRVMSHAFDSQTELGRLCDERVYGHDLAARLVSARVGKVRAEVPITVTHRDFTKLYRMDLLLNDGAVYELKTDSRLVSDHEAQLLNYLFLFGAARGKLVNFRPARVETRFLNNPLTKKARWRMEAETTRWQETDEVSARLRQTMMALLEDWGGFLDFVLYTEALTYFLGGEQRVVQMVPLRRDGISLGNQRLHLVNAEIAFRVTALADFGAGYEPHLRALLQHSPLRAIQWINLARHQVHFVTLTK